MPDEVVPFFTAVRVEEFTWKVRVPVPRDGKYVYATFDARFKYMSPAEADDLVKEHLTDRQLAERVLVGVILLQGESEPKLRTEPEVIAQVLDVDRAPQAVFGTFVAAINGLAQGKN